MRAIRVKQFGGPEVLQLVTLPEPEPGPGQVLVRLHAIGVNPVDTYIRAGTYAKKPDLPYTPGADAAGVVEKLGAGVADVIPGQRVYLAGSVSGTYADVALCDRTQVHPLPEKVGFPEGAALGVPYATAHAGLFLRGEARAGEIVLVHGASGGVGTAAVQLARAAGLQVFGTAGTEAGRAHALAQGAHAVFDHTTPGYLDDLLARTEGRGLDLILEMLANVNLGRDLRVLAPQGRIVVIGSRGSVEVNPRDLMGRNADIRGLMLFGVPRHELARIHAALGAGLENGTLQPVIGRTFPLAEAAAAHEAVLSPGAIGKIVLLP